MLWIIKELETGEKINNYLNDNLWLIDDKFTNYINNDNHSKFKTVYSKQ